MGFHEDDRIRRKNLNLTNNSIIIQDVSLKLNNIPVSDVVTLLINSGYTVELGPNKTIEINRKRPYEEKRRNGNSTTGSLRTNIISDDCKTRSKD